MRGNWDFLYSHLGGDTRSCKLASQSLPTKQLTTDKLMDREEVIKKLDESGVDYEVTAEHEDGFHIIVKFEKEENNV